MQFVHIMLECCTAGGEAELLVAEWWDWKAEGRGELIPRNFPRATTSSLYFQKVYDKQYIINNVKNSF